MGIFAGSGDEARHDGVRLAVETVEHLALRNRSSKCLLSSHM